MSILDRACKYNCPIEFTIRSCNYGWTKMRYKIQDNIFDWNISYIGMQPSIMIEALYIFSSYNNDSDGQLDVETEYEEIKEMTLLHGMLKRKQAFVLTKRDQSSYGLSNEILKILRMMISF